MAASFFRGFLGSVPEQGEKDQQLLITRVHARRSLRSYRRTARAVQKAVDPNEPEEVTKERMRKLVTAELIDTERKYLEDLDRMQSCFIAPIRAKFGDNHNPEWGVLLLQLATAESIYESNKGLYEELSEKILSEPDTAIGSTLVKMASRLHFYSVFCNQQETANEKLKELTKSNSQFRALLQKGKEQNGYALDLVDYLVKPFQRLFKYPLLLKELLKHTPESHPDYQNLTNALQSLEKTVDEINNVKTNSDNLRKMLAIHSSIVDHKHMNLVHPSRKLILEGTANKFSGGRMKNNLHCFLFNDLFIHCTPQKLGGKLKLCGNVMLTKIIISDTEDTKEIRHAIKITRKEKASKPGEMDVFTYFLCYPSQEEKNKWLSAFLEQQKQLSPTAPSKPPRTEIGSVLTAPADRKQPTGIVMGSSPGRQGLPSTNTGSLATSKSLPLMHVLPAHPLPSTPIPPEGSHQEPADQDDDSSEDYDEDDDEQEDEDIIGVEIALPPPSRPPPARPMPGTLVQQQPQPQPQLQPQPQPQPQPPPSRSPPASVFMLLSRNQTTTPPATPSTPPPTTASSSPVSRPPARPPPVKPLQPTSTDNTQTKPELPQKSPPILPNSPPPRIGQQYSRPPPSLPQGLPPPSLVSPPSSNSSPSIVYLRRETLSSPSLNSRGATSTSPCTQYNSISLRGGALAGAQRSVPSSALPPTPQKTPTQQPTPQKKPMT